jgi:CPA2 family monovalent cation:H+ antiporter-2
MIPMMLAAVATATSLNLLIRRFDMPTVVGYIITGAIMAWAFQIDLHDDKTLEHVAEFGIVFLMFTIGLEFSFSHLKSMKKEVLLFGLSQVLVTSVVFAAAARWLAGMPVSAAIVIGAALSLSSTAIVLKILNESGQIKAEFGRNSLGILIFQDISVIPILLMVTLLTSEVDDLGALLTQTLWNAVIAVGLLIFAGRFVLGRFFKMVAETNSKEIYMGSILLTVVGASYVAHHFGFSYSLGGFIAGMLIADTIYKYQIEADLIPFRDLLLGVFFVSVGLQIDLGVVAQNMGTIVLLCFAFMLVKAAVLFLLLLPFGDRKAALKTALTLCQIGEFALVVLSLVMANNMLDPGLVQILIVTIVLSMILTPLLLNNADRIVKVVFRERIDSDPAMTSSLLGGHVILIGFGYFGRLVSRMLDEAGLEHVVITDSTDDYVKARELERMTVFGDASDRLLLQQVGIQGAMTTFIALEYFDAIKRVSASIRMIDPHIKVIAKVPTEEEREELENLHQEMVLDGNQQTADLIVGQIRRSKLLAIETSQLKYIENISDQAAAEAIGMAMREQTRLLNVIADSFNAMREGKDVMHIKALHESFAVLSEIISSALERIMEESSPGPAEYERLNILMANQQELEAMSELIQSLGRELRGLAKADETRSLAEIAVEGLDAILLTLMDLAGSYSDFDLEILQKMTAEDGRGLSGIRETYLSAERDLDTSQKAVLLSATNHMDRLRGLFGRIGANYQKLASS